MAGGRPRPTGRCVGFCAHGAERLLEGLVDALLDRGARLVLDLGDLADEQELRALEHALLAERERLLAREEGEPLEDHGHLEEAAGAHLVGVLLEAALPVGDLLDLAVAEQGEDLADVGGADHRAQAHAVGVLLRHPHAGVVGEDPELVEADLAAGDRARLDALDDADAVIRVDDLLTDLELHGDLSFPGLGGGTCGEERLAMTTSFYQPAAAGQSSGGTMSARCPARNLDEIVRLQQEPSGRR